MKTLPLIITIFATSSLVWASNPRGDDLKVEDVDTFTHDFELSPDLTSKANMAREKIIKAGRFGFTRTNQDGIVVTLMVEDDILWVTGIGISGGEGDYALNPTVIPTDIVSKPIRAEWFSGELTGYHGQLLRFHVREFGFILQVKEGKVTSKRHTRFTID